LNRLVCMDEWRIIVRANEKRFRGPETKRRGEHMQMNLFWGRELIEVPIDPREFLSRTFEVPIGPREFLSRAFEVPIRPGGDFCREVTRSRYAPGGVSVGSFRGPETARKSKGLHGRREREEKRERVWVRAVAAKSVQTLRISNASNRYEFGCFDCCWQGMI
jgi:hypothetical protein